MSLLPFWTKELTPEVIKKAELELGETPEVREKALAELRKLIVNEEGLSIPTDDSFLIRFLRAKKYDVKRSLKCLKGYYGLKAKYPEMLNKTPSEVKDVLEKNIYYVTMKRSYEGEGVLVIRVGELDENVLTVEDVIGAGFVSIDIGIDAEYSQICGSSLIFDFNNVTLKTVSTFATTKILSLLARGEQGAWPHRVNGVHMINEPAFLTVFFNIVKPMLSQKIRDRLHFHGKDLKSLHKFYPAEILPEQLGGTAGPKEFKEFQSSIQERQKLGEKLTEFTYKGVKYGNGNFRSN